MSKVVKLQSGCGLRNMQTMPLLAVNIALWPLLKRMGCCRYQLLNAKPENVERESEIVAQSGRKGAVTIATNMAGRGTDIILGGNAEFQARYVLHACFRASEHRLLMPCNRCGASLSPQSSHALAGRSVGIRRSVLPAGHS